MDEKIFAKLLPIGTVVNVRDANHSMMITGILPEMEGKRYDYISVLYPEGYMTADQVYLFDHKDIEKVEFIGFMNADHQVFRDGLRAVLEEEDGQGAQG